MLLDSDFLEGVPNGVLERMGREERDREYRDLVDSVNALTSVSEADIARLRRHLAEIVRRDHFGASGRDAAEFAVRSLSQRESAVATETAVSRKGATWVTRAGIKVDRMASAWLIRRWIDPDATFRSTARATRSISAPLRASSSETALGSS